MFRGLKSAESRDRDIGVNDAIPAPVESKAINLRDARRDKALRHGRARGEWARACHGLPRRRAAMTRNERAAELTKLLETEAGLNELAEVYRQVCHHQEMATPDLTPAMMIDGATM